jgi:integrase
MKGSVKKRANGTWRIIFDLPAEPVKDSTTGAVVADATTGRVKMRRRQKWVTFSPTPGTSHKEAKKQADAKLAELLGHADKGTFIDATKTTVIDYLRDWVEKAVKPPLRRPETYRVYKNFIDNHVAVSAIAHLPLQKLRTSDLERLYADSALAPASLSVYHAVLSRALRKAVKERFIPFNPALEVENRPRQKRTDRTQRIKHHCWSAEEARKVLNAAKTASPQMAAFVFLAFDSGARKSELYGLTWADLDFEAGTISITRQLDKAGVEPLFGPTKTDGARTIPLNPETVTRLRAHKRAQAALKMANRTTYRDFGLVFAREPEHLQRPKAELGQPLKSLDRQPFKQLVVAAGVRPIKFHGLRHTCATLLLGAGVPVNVVAQRLGHVDATMTLEVYAHVLPSMQTDAAAKLGALLHG